MCSNNVSITRHFFDATTFRVYVTACRAPNLEKSVIFGKQLRLKIIPCVPKSEPLNILQQQPQICSDLNKILHTQDDICYKDCSELVREERSIAAAPLQRQQDVMTSLAASPSQSTPRSRRAAANQRPAGQHQGYKRRAPFQNRHSMRRERICPISPIDRRVSEL